MSRAVRPPDDGPLVLAAALLAAIVAYGMLLLRVKGAP